jgi:hypothetical protein
MKRPHTNQTSSALADMTGTINRTPSEISSLANYYGAIPPAELASAMRSSLEAHWVLVMEDQQNDNDDWDRNTEQPQQDSASHILSP